jgi:hypothetical protein
VIWTQANREIVLTLVTWPVSILSTQLLIRYDEKRLAPEQLERAWLPTTRDLMTMMLGPLCLPMHALKTRWGSLAGAAKGLVLGVLAALLGYVPVEVAGQLVDLVLRE